MSVGQSVGRSVSRSVSRSDSLPFPAETITKVKTLLSLFQYCFHHSKIKFTSSRHRVISSIFIGPLKQLTFISFVYHPFKILAASATPTVLLLSFQPSTLTSVTRSTGTTWTWPSASARTWHVTLDGHILVFVSMVSVIPPRMKKLPRITRRKGRRALVGVE